VRLGRPQLFPGLAAANSGPGYATALGLLISAATTAAESTDPNPPPVAPPRRAGVAGWLTKHLFE